MNTKPACIIYFDGVCNLCNGFVDFVISRDTDGKFKFAPLQGESAKANLPASLVVELNSVILWQNGQIRQKSDAALAIISGLGGPWVMAKVFWIVPQFLRNLVYDFVAKNRYALFGSRSTCRLPTAEERSRFLT